MLYGNLIIKYMVNLLKILSAGQKVANLILQKFKRRTFQSIIRLNIRV
jgi:hypothetical protein